MVVHEDPPRALPLFDRDTHFDSPSFLGCGLIQFPLQQCPNVAAGGVALIPQGIEFAFERGGDLNH